MSNNKQNGNQVPDVRKMGSSVEWFAQQLYETLEIKGDGYVIDSLLDLAKAMHKEEIIKAWKKGDGEFDKVSDKMSLEYYNETYGGNNE